MNKGKDKCDFLRNIRRQVAEMYGLRYEPRECRHEGDCPGTCPVCDAELRDLQRQLKERGVENIDLFEQVEAALLSDEKPQNLGGIPEPYPEDDDDIHILEGDVTPPEDFLRLQGEPDLPEDDEVVPFRFCYVAGISFHNINDIWDELCIGAKLALVRQPDNEHDKNAIAVALADDYDPEDPESFDFNFILGYIPRSDNEDLASMMDAGYQFSAEITKLNRNAPYNERLGITIMRHIEDSKPSARYRAMEVDDDEFKSIQDSLLTEGFICQRWLGSYGPIVMPIKGEKVVVLHKRENDTVLYLTTVAAVGDEATFFIGEEAINGVDNRVVYILLNSVGPVVVPNWSLDFLDKEDIETMEPSAKFLSKAAQVKLFQIFTSALK